MYDVLWARLHVIYLHSPLTVSNLHLNSSLTVSHKMRSGICTILYYSHWYDSAAELAESLCLSSVSSPLFTFSLCAPRFSSCISFPTSVNPSESCELLRDMSSSTLTSSDFSSFAAFSSMDQSKE